MNLKKHKPGRWILLLAGLCVFYFVFAGKEGLLRLYQQHRQEQALKQQIMNLHATIDSLKTENRQLRSDTTYIERIARERLGMARKDETIYKFIEKRKEK